MTYKKIIAIALILLSAGMAPRLALSEPITFYQYLTNYEVTGLGDIIWFWGPDTFWGPFRSNDYVGIRYGSPIFMDYFITSQPDRGSIPDSIFLGPPPIFNAPPYYFPSSADNLRRQASPWISSLNGRMMTRLKFRGARGIEVHQYPLGSLPCDSLIMVIQPSQNGIIFVDGQVEVEGTVIGQYSIGSSGDMWLIDDIRYDGANLLNGDFNPEAMPHKLALVSEGNIIIKNNRANGRENGWQFGSIPNQTDRHSIVITASLVALGESFTFEDQNDEWDIYQGPIPDERGIIHLRGGGGSMAAGIRPPRQSRHRAWRRHRIWQGLQIRRPPQTGRAARLPPRGSAGH